MCKEGVLDNQCRVSEGVWVGRKRRVCERGWTISVVCVDH